MFLDRLTGGRLSELPTALLPGRYRLLDSFLFNDHSKLSAGDLLPDDGSGVIRIDGEERKIAPVEQSDEDQADSELSAEAIVAIAGKIVNAVSGSHVSPMLPAEMAAQCELDDVEKYLADVLRGGHLHSISDRPRIDLQYDDLVAPVARVRRLATSALSHLASHSDCWQQRTLSGVQPRKILARFSEDDYAIYENRLYKRLLDRLDRHLAKRLERIRALNSRIEEYERFRLSQNLHHRLYHDICFLWGQAFLSQEMSSNSNQNETDKDEKPEVPPEQQLEDQLRSIRSLKGRGLYKFVPSSAVVPAQVHRTNILNHDPHYRHLPPLWEKLKDEREDRQLSPEERLAKHRQLQLAYRSYVGLVLRRALERYGLRNDVGERFEFDWAGRNFFVEEDDQDWLFVDSEGNILRLIPIAWFGTSIEDGQDLAQGRVVCWPGRSNSIASNQRLPVSPLDLYVVEKMGRLVDEWMLMHLVKGYACKLGPLPTPVKRLTDGWSQLFESLSATHVRLLAPLDAKQVTEINALLRASANSQVETSILTAIEQVNALTRLCGHIAQITPSTNQEFYCRCRTCETTWSLKTSGDKTIFSMRPKGASNQSSTDGFNWSGRDWLDFEVNL